MLQNPIADRLFLTRYLSFFDCHSPLQPYTLNEEQLHRQIVSILTDATANSHLKNVNAAYSNLERENRSLKDANTGLVNVFNAVNYQTKVFPGELLLNDTSNFVST